jgi:hypothetical protein
VCPNFFEIFSSDFIEFSMKKFFNNSCIVCLNIMKPPWCTPAHQGLFLRNEECEKWEFGLGWRPQHDKTKQTNYLP